MSAVRLPSHVSRALVEEGIAPPNCSSIELYIPASGVLVLRYEVFVTFETLAKIGRAFSAPEPEPES